MHAPIIKPQPVPLYIECIRVKDVYLVDSQFTLWYTTTLELKYDKQAIEVRI